ncbi:pantetheinase-like isoform X2 [Parasteatoda tepidariorum]|uniref:pantetheinase-like isoform X1 n=1 Tax=Parasteatoda tepidariorum TaxID=114398 RepID=UPI00077FD28F|nr:pantetheinase-like isoform X1 [Parasteatoda tepidariorum]XP_042896647.1 pantetheinase-like isoform X2 [Parasteatoda tepidariorum]
MSTKCVIVIVVCAATVLVLIYFGMSVLPEIENQKNPHFYKAAVVEVVPFTDPSMSIFDVILENLNTYQLAADQASFHAVDIIVFPEGMLFTAINDFSTNRTVLIDTIANDIPNPANGDFNPCDQEEDFKDHFLLRILSCMAKSNEFYVVANMVDYKLCRNNDDTSDKNATTNCSDKSECPEDGFYLYNTNVVFNREGKLVARYYKKHLYNEPAMNPTKCYQNGNFETDFGNFTTFISFDILFKGAIEAVQQKYVDNLALSTNWHDQTPFFLFAHVLGQSYSLFNQINTLGANAHVPGKGSLGSGIFSVINGTLMATHQPDAQTKLLISNVPKFPKNYTATSHDLMRKRYHLVNNTFVAAPLLDEIKLHDLCEEKYVGPVNNTNEDYRCQSPNLADFKFKKLLKVNDTIDLCSNLFCCSLVYKAFSMNEDYFLAVEALNVTIYNMSHFYSESCFLARCKLKSNNTCSSLFLNSETIFEEVTLKGNFTQKFIFPTSVDSSVRLTRKEKWSFDGKHQIVYKNPTGNSSLLFLGLEGRDYPDP